MSEHDELVKRLREMYVANGTNYVQAAADLIERISEENTKLKIELEYLHKQLSECEREQEIAVRQCWETELLLDEKPDDKK